MGFTSPIMLDPELESLCLGNHAVVNVFLQIGGQSRYRYHQIVALFLGVVLIVMIHRGAMIEELISWDVAAQCRIDRGSMHAKFAHDSDPIFCIMQKRNSHGPIVLHT